MKKAIVEISPPDYQAIMSHLLPGNTWNEQAAFAYANAEVNDGILFLRVFEWEPILSTDFTHHSDFYLELGDEKRAQVIKRAHDLKASMVEWHSHPFLWPASFSFSDLSGFSEFVPHVLWRLKGRPYAAIVVTPFDFDALIWSKSPEPPCQISALKVGLRNLFPTALTLRNKRSSHAQ